MDFLTLTASLKFLGRSSCALGSLFRSSSDNKATNTRLAVIDSLLPTSAFKVEILGSGLTIGKTDQTDSLQFLNLITYLISNNFPSESNTTEIYQWLKSQRTFSPGIFHTLTGPSAEALLENLFRLSVEAEDVPMAKNLIQAGASPNGNTCTHEDYLVPLTPLQFACLKGNTPLVEVLIEALIRAGLDLDEPRSSWNCSALVLAIFGCRVRAHWNTSSGCWETQDKDNETDCDQEDDDNPEDESYIEPDLENLMKLIRILASAGASVNVIANDDRDAEKYIQGWRKVLEPSDLMYPLLAGRHSPLTMASRYRYKNVVKFLIQKGADVRFRVNGLHSALRECLYDGKELYQAVPYEDLDTLDETFDFSAKCEDRPESAVRSTIISIVRSLIEAGADLNDHAECNYSKYSNYNYCMYYNFECYSALDLAVLIGSPMLVEIMLSNDAKTTTHSLDLALKIRNIDVFSQLLDSGAPIPTWATSEGDEESCSFHLNTNPENANTMDLRRKRALILAAIRLGATSVLVNLVSALDVSYKNFLDGCYELTYAVEECCRGGHSATLRCLLGSNIMPRSPLAPALGRSIVLAIEYNHMSLVDMLLDAGADVNEAWFESEEVTPLLLAIRRNDLLLVQKFIKAGSEVAYILECTSEDSEAHKTPGNLLVAAIEAGNDAIVEEIIETGVDLNALGACRQQRSGLNCTCCAPITMAILKQKWSLVDCLLRAGTYINSASSDIGVRACRSPLWAVVLGRHFDLACFLIENGAEVNDRAAVEAAIDDEELLKLLVERLTISGNLKGKRNALDFALCKAIRSGSPEAVRLILKSKIVNLSTFENVGIMISPLQEVFTSAPENRPEYLRLLLAAGANPNSIVNASYIRRGYGMKPSIKWTALLAAISTRDREIVQMILDAGAKVNGKFQSHVLYSPVQFAVVRGYADILRILLTKDSDPNVVSPWGQDPCGGVYSCGAAIQSATERKNFEIVQMLLKHNANPDTVTRNRPHTALQIAARDGCKSIVELLLEYGANVNSPAAENCGATALQFAAIGGYLGIAYLLLEKEADPNAPPAKIDGRTALEGAAEHGRIDMVQLLKNAGADISEAGHEQYERALSKAYDNGHYATHKLLRSYMS